MNTIESPPVTPVSPWRLVCWTDEAGREVRRTVCHESEVGAVMDLPFPHRAVAREPVYEQTALAGLVPWDFHRRHPFGVGFTFTDNVNQGDRPCAIVAANGDTGDFIYEYEMPGGRTFLRNRRGRPVSRNRLPAWAKEQLA